MSTPSELDELLDEAYEALDEGNPDEAIHLAEQALLLDEEDPDAFVVLGAAHFERLRLPEANANLKIALELDEQNPDAHWWMGLVEERQGNGDRAVKHFREATRLDRETYPAPFPLSEKEFRGEVEKAIAALPADFRLQLQNLAIVVEALPGNELLEGDPPLPPTILGLHVGTPRPEHGTTTSPGPNTIFLFQKNIERAATSRDELDEQIEVTLLHEIGHYLGLDEDDVDERGLQ